MNITMCRAKANGNYMNSMLALREALDTGMTRALLLDANGFVMEGSARTSLSCVTGVLYTPDLTSCPRRHHPPHGDPLARGRSPAG